MNKNIFANIAESKADSNMYREKFQIIDNIFQAYQNQYGIPNLNSNSH